MAGENRLSYTAFAMIVIVYLAITHGGGRVSAAVWGSGDGVTTTRDVVVSMWIRIRDGLVVGIDAAMWRGTVSQQVP